MGAPLNSLTDIEVLVVAFDQLSACHIEMMVREDMPRAKIAAATSLAEMQIALNHRFDMIVVDTRNIPNVSFILESCVPLVEHGCRFLVIVINDHAEALAQIREARASFGIPHGVVPATMTPARCREAMLHVALGNEYLNWIAFAEPTAEQRRPAGPGAVVPAYLPDGDGALPANLTPREKQILHLLKYGLRNKEVAEHIGISVNTAKVHVASIKRKLRATHRMQMTI